MIEEEVIDDGMTDEERGLMRLRDNLELYSATCLKVLPKEGGQSVPFIWNKAQKYIHAELEKQRKAIGYVRAIILKGRQQGCSTYVGARFYQKTSMTHGLGAFIMTHEDKATTNLFNMVKRYDAHNPIAPDKKASNAQELIFGRLDSGYKLATAGSKDVGRSNTARLFHGSEVGFWANAASHMSGIGETIPSGAKAAGTEIILESTANGLGNYFHTLWQEAEAGRGEYLAIFVPWFWQDEYRTPVKPNFELSSEDREYQAAYGLDMEQMQWRANKIADKGVGMEWLFDQEYPATPAIAFKTSTKNPLCSPNSVMAAANSDFRERTGPLIIACDPAGDGEGDGDRTAIAFRQGRTAFRVEYHEKKSPMQVAGILAGYFNEFQPDGMLIDKGGLGAGIYDRLVELNVPIIGINNAERARDSERYENKRAEMWWLMAEWFNDKPNRIPNDPALISDICAPQPTVHSSGRKLLESKKDMKKRGIRSPDGADALALTFAETIIPRSQEMAGHGHSGYRAPTNAGY